MSETSGKPVPKEIQKSSEKIYFANPNAPEDQPEKHNGTTLYLKEPLEGKLGAIQVSKNQENLAALSQQLGKKVVEVTLQVEDPRVEKGTLNLGDREGDFCTWEKFASVTLAFEDGETQTISKEELSLEPVQKQEKQPTPEPEEEIMTQQQREQHYQENKEAFDRNINTIVEAITTLSQELKSRGVGEEAVAKADLTNEFDFPSLTTEKIIEQGLPDWTSEEAIKAGKLLTSTEAVKKYPKIAEELAKFQTSLVDHLKMMPKQAEIIQKNKTLIALFEKMYPNGVPQEEKTPQPTQTEHQRRGDQEHALHGDYEDLDEEEAIRLAKEEEKQKQKQEEKQGKEKKEPKQKDPAQPEPKEPQRTKEPEKKTEQQPTPELTFPIVIGAGEQISIDEFDNSPNLSAAYRTMLTLRDGLLERPDQTPEQVTELLEQVTTNFGYYSNPENRTPAIDTILSRMNQAGVPPHLASMAVEALEKKAEYQQQLKKYNQKIENYNQKVAERREKTKELQASGEGKTLPSMVDYAMQTSGEMGALKKEGSGFEKTPFMDVQAVQLAAHQLESTLNPDGNRPPLEVIADLKKVAEQTARKENPFDQEKNPNLHQAWNKLKEITQDSTQQNRSTLFKNYEIPTGLYKKEFTETLSEEQLEKLYENSSITENPFEPGTDLHQAKEKLNKLVKDKLEKRWKRHAGEQELTGSAFTTHLIKGLSLFENRIKQDELIPDLPKKPEKPEKPTIEKKVFVQSETNLPEDFEIKKTGKTSEQEPNQDPSKEEKPEQKQDQKQPEKKVRGDQEHALHGDYEDLDEEEAVRLAKEEEKKQKQEEKQGKEKKEPKQKDPAQPEQKKSKKKTKKQSQPTSPSPKPKKEKKPDQEPDTKKEQTTESSTPFKDFIIGGYEAIASRARDLARKEDEGIGSDPFVAEGKERLLWLGRMKAASRQVTSQGGNIIQATGAELKSFWETGKQWIEDIKNEGILESVKMRAESLRRNIWKKGLFGEVYKETYRQQYLKEIQTAGTHFAEESLIAARLQARKEIQEEIDQKWEDKGFLGKIGAKIKHQFDLRIVKGHFIQGKERDVYDRTVEILQQWQENGRIAEFEAHKKAEDAILTRFEQDADELSQFIHEEAGEKLTFLDEEDPKQAELAKNIRSLLARYVVEDDFNEVQFKHEFNSLLQTEIENLDDQDDLKQTAQNLLEADFIFGRLKELADAYRGKRMHEQGVAALEKELEDIKIGLAAAEEGGRTENELTKTEKILGKVPLAALFNEATAATGTSIAITLVDKLTTRVARTAGHIALPILGGATAGGIVAGIKEVGRLKGERLREIRREELGDHPTPEQVRRFWFEKAGINVPQVEAVSAIDTVGKVGEIIYKNQEEDQQFKENVDTNQLRTAFADVIDLRARVLVSDRTKRGLISYSNREAVEQQRTSLDLALNQARKDIIQYLEANPDKKRAICGDASPADFFEQAVKVQIGEIEGTSIATNLDPQKLESLLGEAVIDKKDTLKKIENRAQWKIRAKAGWRGFRSGLVAFAAGSAMTEAWHWREYMTGNYGSDLTPFQKVIVNRQQGARGLQQFTRTPVAGVETNMLPTEPQNVEGVLHNVPEGAQLVDLDGDGDFDLLLQDGTEINDIFGKNGELLPDAEETLADHGISVESETFEPFSGAEETEFASGGKITHPEQVEIENGTLKIYQDGELDVVIDDFVTENGKLAEFVSVDGEEVPTNEFLEANGLNLTIEDGETIISSATQPPLEFGTPGNEGYLKVEGLPQGLSLDQDGDSFVMTVDHTGAEIEVDAVNGQLVFDKEDLQILEQNGIEFDPGENLDVGVNVIEETIEGEDQVISLQEYTKEHMVEADKVLEGEGDFENVTKVERNGYYDEIKPAEFNSEGNMLDPNAEGTELGMGIYREDGNIIVRISDGTADSTAGLPSYSIGQGVEEGEVWVVAQTNPQVDTPHLSPDNLNGNAFMVKIEEVGGRLVAKIPEDSPMGQCFGEDNLWDPDRLQVVRVVGSEDGAAQIQPIASTFNNQSAEITIPGQPEIIKTEVPINRFNIPEQTAPKITLTGETLQQHTLIQEVSENIPYALKSPWAFLLRSRPSLEHNVMKQEGLQLLTPEQYYKDHYGYESIKKGRLPEIIQIEASYLHEGLKPQEILRQEIVEADNLAFAFNEKIGDTIIAVGYIQAIIEKIKESGQNVPNIYLSLPDGLSFLKKSIDNIAPNVHLGNWEELVREEDKTTVLDFSTYNTSPSLEKESNNVSVIRGLLANAVESYTKEGTRFTDFAQDILGEQISSESQEFIPEIIPPDKHEKTYKKLAKEYNVDTQRPNVSLVVETDNPGKQYSQKNWISVASSLTDQGFQVNIIYNPNNKSETRTTRETWETLINDHQLNHVSVVEGSLEEISSFLQHQNAVASNDTGLAHIASTLQDGPKVTTLYLPGFSKSWVINKKRETAIEASPGQEGGGWNCTIEDKKWINNIEPEQIVETILQKPKTEQQPKTYEITVQKPLFIGRKENQRLKITDESISEEHAVISSSKKGEFKVVDHHSEEGTFVNGQKIKPTKPVKIENGDRVRFGNLEFAVATQGTEIELTPIETEVETTYTLEESSSSLANKEHSKVCEDAVEHQLLQRDGKTISRWFVVDGSGGSHDDHQVVRSSAQTMAEVARDASLPSPREVLIRADTEGQKKPGYGTGIVAEVDKQTGKVNIAAEGDCIAFTWRPKGYQNKRAYDPQGKPHQFQQLTQMQNLAEGKRKANMLMTQELEGPDSSAIFANIGDPENVNHNTIQETSYNLQDDEVLLLASDGIRMGDILIENGGYGKKLNNILMQFHQGKITLEQANNKLVKAAEKQAEKQGKDYDDISLVLVKRKKETKTTVKEPGETGDTFLETYPEFDPQIDEQELKERMDSVFPNDVQTTEEKIAYLTQRNKDIGLNQLIPKERERLNKGNEWLSADELNEIAKRLHIPMAYVFLGGHAMLLLEPPKKRDNNKYELTVYDPFHDGERKIISEPHTFPDDISLTEEDIKNANKKIVQTKEPIETSKALIGTVGLENIEDGISHDWREQVQKLSNINYDMSIPVIPGKEWLSEAKIKATQEDSHNCTLWTLFHAAVVHAMKEGENEFKEKGLPILEREYNFSLITREKAEKL